MDKSADDIKSLPSLGPKIEAMLATIGIHTASDFLARDPYEVYQALHQVGIHIGLNGMYAFVSAHENIDWLTVAKNHREEIIMRLDDMGLAPK